VGACSFVEDGALLFGELDTVRALGGHPFSFLESAMFTKILLRRRKCIKEVQSGTT
jgi:hypothetical protein